jgi:hypothetical protein
MRSSVQNFFIALMHVLPTERMQNRTHAANKNAAKARVKRNTAAGKTLISSNVFKSFRRAHNCVSRVARVRDEFEFQSRDCITICHAALAYTLL